MPIESYPQNDFQPECEDAILWRFMPFARFEDLIRTGELYFCRADLLDDKNEGIPSEEYIRSACASMLPEYDIDNMIGQLVQDKESYFISCWYLFDHETAKMWGTFASNGVAICTRYSLLKLALNALEDRAMLGLVRYSYEHTGFNVLRFITTKLPEFAEEREVRALIWKPEWAGHDRHIGADDKFHRVPLTDPPSHVLPGLRRSVNLHMLIEKVVVSPDANEHAREKVEKLLREFGYAVSVEKSALSKFPHVITDPKEIIRFTTKPK